MTKSIIYSKLKSGLLVKRRIQSNLIIAAPHHTIGGIKKLQTVPPRDADENTGFIANEIAKKINSSALIGYNAAVDYNKHEDSVYYKKITEWKPEFLIEIHGHGGIKADENTIEISSGNKDRESLSIQFAKVLNKFMIKHM